MGGGNCIPRPGQVQLSPYALPAFPLSFHSSKLAFSIHIPGSLSVYALTSGWVIVDDHGKYHRGRIIRQFQPLSDQEQRSDKGEKKGDLGSSVWVSWPLWVVCLHCVFPEHCVQRTSHSLAACSLVTEIDTPVSQMEAGSWGWGVLCFRQPPPGNPSKCR